MKKKRVQYINIDRLFFTLCGILLAVCLSALSILLVSCEKDATSTSGLSPGGEVLLRVSVVGVNESEETELTRSTDGVVKTVNIPMADGGRLEASLNKVSTQTRATTSLSNNVTYRVIAFKQGQVNASGFVSYGDFTVSGATTTNTFHVPEGYTYTFVCYSLNTISALPPFDKNSLDITVAPSSYDLLYYKFDQAITASNHSLLITFVHKFSRIQVVADASDMAQNITTISAQLSPNYSTILTLANGNLTATGASSSITIPWGTITAGTTVTSSPATIFTNGASDITVNLSSVTIGGLVKTGFVLPFSGATLETGKSYVIRLKFKKGFFAGSNIYWDGTKLTFDDVGVTTHEHYQGVFFMWGSLVAMSPALTNGAVEFSYSETPMYVPNVVNNTWSKTTASAMSWSTWEDFPYVPNEVTPADLNETYLTNLGSSYYSQYKGDICKYLSDKGYAPNSTNGWRMPTANEFNAGSSYVKSGSFGDNLTSNVNGTATVAPGYIYDNIFFPASGIRFFMANGGNVASTGSSGYVWSNSHGGTRAQSMYLLFDTNRARLWMTYCSTAVSVRCVRN
ncbi:MAG: hypothetical protein LKI39_05990 [Bacteroides sp.]|jgi:uncharacterized protein (TIGR02145 family)|nr:hypothetical protein [Bacteroides sp.]